MDIGISHIEIITTLGFGTKKTSTLVYANINGTEFGEVVNSVYNLSNGLSNYTLHQNYPNPFNPSTIISYSIPQGSFVSLKVYDLLGNEIATLVDEEKHAGSYEVEFVVVGLPSGIYFYKLIANGFTQTKKMILIK